MASYPLATVPDAGSNTASTPDSQHSPQMLRHRRSKFPLHARHLPTFLLHSAIVPLLLASKKSRKRTSFKLSTPAQLATKRTRTMRTRSTSSKSLPPRRRNANPVRPSCRNSRLRLPPLPRRPPLLLPPFLLCPSFPLPRLTLPPPAPLALPPHRTARRPSTATTPQQKTSSSCRSWDPGSCRAN